MKISHASFAATLVLIVSFASAIAQGTAPEGGPDAAQAPAPASAPLSGKPVPRPATPAELRESASPLVERSPEGKVTPQLSFPLGRAPASTSPSLPAELRAARRAAAPTPITPGASDTIDDAAARCGAQADPQQRLDCRAALARRPPGP